MERQAGKATRWAGLCLVLLLVCGAAAAGENGAARVVRVTGQVSVERERDLWALETTHSIRPGEIIVTGPGSYALFELEDGSRFEVFADSRVVFRANRGNWRDLLDIFLGRVKIQIEKLGGRPNPYRVNSATALIAVRGTTFSVNVEPDETTTIIVEEGVVGVSHKLLPGGREIVLNSGQALVVRPGEPLLTSSIGKARVAARILGMALESVLRTVGPGSTRGGGSTTPVPGAPLPGGGDKGQAPPPPPDVPDDDSGPPKP